MAGAMNVTTESLTKRFQLLGDDALQELFHSGDLTELAQGVARAELRRRGISLAKPAVETRGEALETGDEVDPELWSTSSGDLVLAWSFRSAIEAQVLKSRLAADGIPAVVVDAGAVQNYWASNIFGGVRVLVP